MAKLTLVSENFTLILLQTRHVCDICLHTNDCVYVIRSDISVILYIFANMYVLLQISHEYMYMHVYMLDGRRVGMYLCLYVCTNDPFPCHFLSLFKMALLLGLMECEWKNDKSILNSNEILCFSKSCILCLFH